MTMSYRSIIVTGVCALLAAPAWAVPTLDKVRSAGALRCGVISTPEDWNKADLHGPIAPLTLEMCKAVAVAALGVRAKVQAVGFASELEAEQGLSQAAVDLVVGVTPESTAMWHWNIAFGPPVFYDGQGILVRRDLRVASLADLAGTKVCAIEGTENEKILLARTVERGIAVVALPFQEEGEMDDGFAVRHCDAITADLSRLAQVKVSYARQVGQDRILPELLTLSPVAPAYRRDDAQWAMIVDWTIHALVQAEASGITQANVGRQASSGDPVVQRLVGTDWATSRALGLEAHDWAAQVVAVVGNYGEIFERTVGSHSALQMPRGLNALWTQGGLMHPMPVQ
jgi:general L-amino acid transport system substrate-binding protein